MESGEREKGQAPDPVSSLQSGVLVWVSWMLTLKQGIEGYAFGRCRKQWEGGEVIQAGESS